MKKSLLTYLFTFITIIPLWAFGGNNDGDKEEAKKEPKTVDVSSSTTVATTRQFKDLESLPSWKYTCSSKYLIHGLWLTDHLPT